MGNGDPQQVHTHLFDQIYQVFDTAEQELERELTAEALLSGNLAVLLCRYRPFAVEPQEAAGRLISCPQGPLKQTHGRTERGMTVAEQVRPEAAPRCGRTRLPAFDKPRFWCTAGMVANVDRIRLLSYSEVINFPH